MHWAADLINAAQRPLVYFGGGVRSAASCQPLRDLLHKAEIPATYTLMAAGVLSYGEPHNLGLLGMHGCYAANKAIDEADLVIAVGTRFSDRVALNPKTFAKNAKILQIDVDAAEINKNIVVDASVVGDEKEVLKRILAEVPEMRHPEWTAHISELKEKYPLKYDDENLSCPYIMQEIDRVTNGEAIITTDVGQHQMLVSQYAAITEKKKLIMSGGLGTMGYGLGAAIGAKMGRPEKQL